MAPPIALICGENRSLSLRWDERARLVGAEYRSVGAIPQLASADQTTQGAPRHLEPIGVERLDLPADVDVVVGDEDPAFPDGFRILPEAGQQSRADQAVDSLARVALRPLGRPCHGAAHDVAAGLDPDDHRLLGMHPMAVDRPGVGGLGGKSHRGGHGKRGHGRHCRGSRR